MELQPALQTFIAEARELLRDMEAGLLQLEQTPDDLEALNAVFRTAHTIKGSSGMFGFDHIVEFTHLMENVLEDVRSGEILADADLTALLLSCGDHVDLLLDQAAAGNSVLDDALRADGETLAAQLAAYLEFTAAPLPETIASATREPDVQSLGGGTVASETWHISLRFDEDMLRHGMDPLSFIHYLGTLGEIVTVTTLFDTMPAAADMDPEACYLGMEIDFSAAPDKEVNKQTIENVFEFVREDSAIRILPPHSKILDYIQLIDSLPEDKTLLGELLVNSGALTLGELEQGLRLQDTLDGMEHALPTGAEHAHKLGKILVGQGVVQNELVDAALEKQRVVKERKVLENNFVRVRADKLDDLITLVGELVIAGAGVRLLAQHSGNGELIEATSGVEELVGQIRDAALKVRMVPIAETFNRFKRVVRDLGRDLGKEVELVLSGTETELDKSMIEKISDPLMHLVRNALDHGFEMPQLRRQRGKPQIGKLHLNAYHDSGYIVIEVDDDGAGLDRRKIFERAVARGIVSPDQELSDEEVYKLIMAPGFSTADEVTNVSGRGMGMDVVKRNVDALRGSISLESVEGVGTTVVARLPLTLAIIDGFLVGVGNSTYVVPLDMVVECLELSIEDRAALGSRSYINLRGGVLPLLRLRQVFEVQGVAAKRENIVVVHCAGQQAGLVVDALLGEFQTVIKPLGKLFERLGGISGSTILGNGEVALIIDVPALVKKTVVREDAQAKQLGEASKLLTGK